MSTNMNSNIELDADFSSSKTDISLNSSFAKEEALSNNNGQVNFFSTSTPMLNNDDKVLENHSDSGIISNSMNSNPLNEKVASLASSVYTELEKIVKLYGRETVKDLMSILVNILEALDFAYQEKEEQIVENELLKDDYEKLLLQYEREKQARKDTELKLFQSEDSFAEQKRDYEEKVVSLESIVRMIDLKSKNTADHVQRLEEKENELKREYTKLHERYTELFKTHCDYMDRTKILFGNENRADSSNSGTNLNGSGQSATTGRFNRHNRTKGGNTNANSSNSNQLLDMLNSTSLNVNRADLINVIKSSSRADINLAINNLLATQELSEKSNSLEANNIDMSSENSSLTIADDDSLGSESGRQQVERQSSDELSKSRSDLTGCGEDGSEPVDGAGANIHTSENFDEHIRMNVEFDDTASEYSNMNSMTQKDFEEEEEMANRNKNDLSLYNELSRDHYDITELDDGADLTGMSREVANLIRENSELLQTKHALNVLKDDLIVRLDNFSSEMVLLREELKSLQTIKACLQLRISELEEEAKKYKEDLAEKTKKQEEEDENVPMSQRKRFTRAEMARVLMERNQYKERLMDLQEAVRWTEMMRASKVDSSAIPSGAVAAIAAMPGNTNVVSINGSEGGQTAEQHQEHKKKTPMWKFFSDLFGSSSSSQPAQVSPVQSANSNDTSSNQLSPNTKKPLKTTKASSEHTETDTITVNLSEKAAKAYEFLKDDSQSKSIQIRQIDNKTSLVVKEDGRMQAYGWSLPSKTLAGDASNRSVQSNSTPITVPVPVYCRPLFEHDNNLKMSCSSTINFLFDPSCVKNCGELIEASPFSHYRSQINNNEYKSSCIWICNLNENDTHVSVLDANKPGDLIEQFILKQLKIYCIQSISGANQSEFPLSPEKLKALGNNLNELNSKLRQANEIGTEVPEAEKAKEIGDKEITFIECESDQDNALTTAQASHPLANTSEKCPAAEEPTSEANDQEKALTSLFPTMWLGSQEGWLLVHSTISKIKKTIDKVKLKDAILSIVQNGGRVIVGLANGSVVVFNRNCEGLWDLKNYFIINIDRPHHSIRCVINVNDNIWCGIRNKIFVVNPTEFKLGSTIEVHPRKENQVRHMAWINDGVWVSLRLDSTLRLYHAKTLQHLQYVDIEPFITRMLGTSNLGQSMVRISSLLIGAKRLWIGTGNGVILSLPFNESAKEAVNSTNLSKIPGTGVRVSAEPELEAPNNHIPYCNLTEAQFSFHGHRNAIKFFLNVPIEAIQKMNVKTTNKPKEESYEKVETMLVLSGGHGYIDFRIGDSGKSGSSVIEKQSAENKSINKHERSHLIVWQLNNNNNNNANAN